MWRHTSWVCAAKCQRRLCYWRHRLNVYREVIREPRQARCRHTGRGIRPGKGEHMRILHTMIRVGDLDRSLRFYTETLGMKLLRRHDYPDGRFTLAFVGFGDESQQ